MCVDYKIFFLLNIVLQFSYGYKVLVVFAIPGKSHSILGEGYVRHLLAAGHEVTYITPVPLKEPPPNLRQVDVSENFKFLSSDIFNVKSIMTKERDLQDYFVIRDILHGLLYQTFQMPVIQRFINDPKEEYDAVIVEWLYSELAVGFSSVFNCPLIWSSSMIPHTSVLSLISDHSNPAYSVDLMSREYSTAFWDRFHHAYFITKLEFYRWLERDEYNEYFKNIFGEAILKRGYQLPHFDDVKYNASLMLGNSHPVTGDSIPLPENYKHVGGYHIKDSAEPLPKDLQKLMDESSNGVIYFSLGTMLKSSSIPEGIRRNLLNMFSELKQTVIWKIEQSIPDVPKNVHVVTWAPQTSILAHPNCVLFISHGGLLSIMETLTAGVPIIGMPFFADQYMNIARAALKGFGKRIDLNENAPELLRFSINEMVGNSSYRLRVKELSAIFKNNIATPGEQLVYWVEYVIRTKYANHLRSPALKTMWYKKVHLDIVLVLLLGLMLILKLCKNLLRFIGIGESYKLKRS